HLLYGFSLTHTHAHQPRACKYSSVNTDTSVSLTSPGVGPRGPEGEKGPSGEQSSGVPSGLAGEPGPLGSCGVPGPCGSSGEPGLPGPPGVSGSPGCSGKRGVCIEGLKGDKGSPGGQGPKGNRVHQIQIVCSGINNVCGSTGLPGSQGPPGASGTGFKGEKGSKGAAGTAGLTEELKVASAFNSFFKDSVNGGRIGSTAIIIIINNNRSNLYITFLDTQRRSTWGIRQNKTRIKSTMSFYTAQLGCHKAPFWALSCSVLI
uniref:Uncharacterized protein n=1 Tax=Gouania willdenowi TaxID=441366 RepID=A0A8C5G4Y6_GOUWI